MSNTEAKPDAKTEPKNPFHQFLGEYAAIEAQWVKNAQSAVASWAQLAQDSIAYSVELAAQARRIALEAARKAGAAVGA